MRVDTTALASKFAPKMPQPWNLVEAIRLTTGADAEVERLGVSGLAPGVPEAAVRAAEAFRLMDMPGLVAACEQVKAEARRQARDAA